MAKKSKLNVTVKVNKGNDDHIASVLAKFILDWHSKQKQN